MSTLCLMIQGHLWQEAQSSAVFDLDHRVGQIYDHLYGGAYVKTPDRIAFEVGKILHTIQFLEISENRSPFFQYDAKDLKKNLHSQSLRKEISYMIKGAFAAMNEKWQIYGEENDILLSDFDISFCIFLLSGVIVNDPLKDIFGDVMEIFRVQWTKRNGGQFFTNHRITDLAVQLLDYRPEMGEDFIDICSGTGGFLLAGLRKIKRISSSESEVAHLGKTLLKGQEMDDVVRGIANSTLRTRLGVTDQIVQLGNSLSIGFKDSPIGNLRLDSHDCAATNPPFGTKITIKDASLLARFELAKLPGRRDLINQPPDILFIEKNVKLLKPGTGRLAIVLPYQILSGPKEFYIRNWILRNCIVLAIIDLPADSFQPYTGTKTSLVVLQRRSLPLGNLLESDAYKIFMGIPKHIGHDRRGKPVFKYDPTGNITSEVLTDLQEISLAYDAFKTGASDSDFQNIHPDCFSISSKSVESDEYQRLNAKFYAPVNNFSFSIKSNQLEFKKLADVTKKIFYPGRFKRQYTLPNGYETVPFLGGADITSMIVKTEKYISKTFHKYSELAVETGWLLVTRSGTTGIVSMVPQSWQGFAISEHVIRIIPDETKLSPYYILAYLSSRVGQQAMKKGIYGSVIDEITPDFLSNLTIPIPSDISKYEEIHDKIRHAERNRQSAMAGFGGAIKNIEALFQ